MYVLAGTGSKELRVADPKVRIHVFDQVVRHIYDLKEQKPDLHVMSGMAEGFDETLATAANFTRTPWTAAIPHAAYGEYYWGEKSLTGRDRSKEFESLVDSAANVVIVCPSIYVEVDGWRTHSNFVRNTYMVGAADEFLVWNKRSKGTKHCVAEIRKNKVPFTVISPPEDQFTLF